MFHWPRLELMEMTITELNFWLEQAEWVAAKLKQ